MSGGQVQRVAIARALINDPSIILADEPTGALDTETSTQVMAILKEISEDRLVIMVTHNPDLAEAYSTRIVRLSDGQVISDSDPFLPGSYEVIEGISVEPDARNKAVGRAVRRRNKSMSLGTALHLSLNNLMTKKARTLLTAFAGSIGIIGIALILSVSNGFQTYIDKLEEDTLSSYPLTIMSETADMTSMITAFMANASDTEGEDSGGKMHEQQIMTDLLASVGSNDLASFKKHIDSNIDTIGDWFNSYQYSYGLSVNIYSTNMEYGPLRVSPGSIMQSYMSGLQQSSFSMMNTDVFFQMMDNEELLKSQYKVLAGTWPEKYDELLLVLDSEDQLNDYIVYTLGLRDPQELKDMINDVMDGERVENNNKRLEWTYDDFLGMEFALVHACDTYRRNSSYEVWEDMSDDEDYMEDLIKKSEKLHISGIVCAKEASGANAMTPGVGYLPSLTQHMIEYAAESDIVKIQRLNKSIDVFSGKSFEDIRSNNSEGLGFEDMISIDEGKLKKALGGDIDPNAIQKDIEKIAKKEIKDLAANDSAEKIEEDVNKALADGCNDILKNLRSQAKDSEIFSVSNDSVSKALNDSLDSGKHSRIVNPLLNGYAEVIKAAAPDMQTGVKMAVINEAIKGGVSQMGLTISDEQTGQIAAVIAKNGSIDEDTLRGIAPDLPDAMIPMAVGALNSIPSQIPASAFNEALFTALSQTVEPYTTNSDVQDGIKQYGQGIEMLQDAQVVGPALGKAAEAVGKQFNIDPSGIADAFTMKMDEDEITRLITAYISGGAETSYDTNLQKLGYADVNNPFSMSFFLKDFESKENFLKFIDDYNQEMTDNGDEDMVISYTDVTGVLIKSVKNITNAVSYVLIAFVAISLVVSSIMIGVITYISVLERTKEIGILRAIGASKKDIARIFNAETIIIGLCAGVIGIGLSLLLLIPINRILIGLTKISALKAILPAAGGVALVIISIFLTFIAGLIPSGMAARKDPVVALRTE